MSDKAISIVTAEWEALAGLPYLQVRLYLVLRWYMSVATRRVGDVRGISLQGLCEELYIEPAPGRVESGPPTKKAVRSALAQLEKHGLVEPCGNGEVLVFLLPKAETAFTREKLKGHKRGTAKGHGNGHTETPAEQGVQAEKGHTNGHPQNPIKGHTSEVIVNPLSVEPASAAQPYAVERNLSTALLLQLPLEPEKVAEWIRLHERERGCRAKVVATSQQIADWIAKGVRPEDLREAYRQAKEDRDDTNNQAPINLPFLDIFVKRVLESRGSARRGGGSTGAGAWHTTLEGISRRAEELGEPPRKEGESIESFRGRVSFADGLAQPKPRRVGNG